MALSAEHNKVESLLSRYVNQLVSKYNDAGFDVTTKRISPVNMLGKEDTYPWELTIKFDYVSFPIGQTTDLEALKSGISRSGSITYFLIHNRDISFNPDVDKIILDRGANGVYLHEAVLKSITTPDEVATGKEPGFLFRYSLSSLAQDRSQLFKGSVDSNLDKKLNTLIEIDEKFIESVLKPAYSETEKRFRQFDFKKIEDVLDI